MATYTGNDGALSVNGKAVANVKTFSVDMKADTIETTSMGKDVRTYVKGLASFSGSADVLFDTADWDTAGENTTYNPTDSGSLVGADGVAVKFFIYTDKSSGNDLAFTGNVIVTGYNVKSSFDGLVEATISFQGTDAVTYATGNTVYP
jgi:predicted secreted protein